MPLIPAMTIPPGYRAQSEDTSSEFVCSAEDIVPQKLVWRSGRDSDQQWRDILGVLKVQGDALDQDYLATWASQLNVLTELNRAMQEAGFPAV